MNRLAYYIPLVLLGILAVYFAAGLGRDPKSLESVLIDQKVPEFSLPPIAGSSKGLSNTDLKNQVVLVNVFGSWCVACRVEHPFLMDLKEKNIVPVYGIDWREPDRKAGPRWLKKYGDPYTLIGDDPRSKAAIAFGVTGAPETFVIDRRGVIRYKHIGPLSPEFWDRTLWPLIESLQRQ